MEASNKTGNFLNALRKYSEQERQQMLDKVAAEKAEAVRKADEKGKADADKYIKKLLAEKKAQITSEYAVKTLESKAEVFRRRSEMVDDIFDAAYKKLNDFVLSESYKGKLLSYADEISGLFGGESCTVYLKPDDMKYGDEIRSRFNSQIELKEDISIRLGGIRCYCPSKKQIADNTLDSKLETQREWFVENSNLHIA